MAANSKIEWCHHTFNPWVGCTKVSPACDHCYAESWAKRTGQAHLWAGDRRRTSASYWRQPLKWDRAAAATGQRPRVFCASLADVFDNQVPADWRIDLWVLIAQTPHLDWLLLTKRPQNIGKMLPGSCVEQLVGRDLPWPWPHVWLGTTAENQNEADRRIPHLLATPAAVRFLSAEPLLGPIDLTRIPHSHPAWPEDGDTCTLDAIVGGVYDSADYPVITCQAKLDWVIVGGESGPHARPMHPQWARAIRDQCAAAEVPFFMKQLSGPSGRAIKDVAAFPADLQIREWPDW